MDKVQTKTRYFAPLGVLTLFAIVAIAPHAFAQENPAGQGQQNGIPLGGNYGVTTTQFAPATPDATAMGWSAGIAIISVMTGIGVWTAVRKH